MTGGRFIYDDFGHILCSVAMVKAYSELARQSSHRPLEINIVIEGGRMISSVALLEPNAGKSRN